MNETSRPALARTTDYHGQWGRACPVDVPVEAGFGLIYGGLPHVVLMATPANLAELAIGFTITEGIARDRSEIRSVAIEPVRLGHEARIDLAPDAMHRFLARRRAMSGRTGCGICGLESLDQLESAARRVAGPIIAPEAIARALAGLAAGQPLNAATRAVHGAGFFDLSGTCLALREDVGRHNALDKLIGACLEAGHDPKAGFVVITSRCSFEMVEKTALFGAATLVAISAPTSLAIERANALGLTLIAIARADAALAFTAPLAAIRAAP